jgi:putative ABC transport system permease protein
MVCFIPFAWLQLSKEKLRLAVAIAGVGFAVVLILMQLGFQEALFASSVRYHAVLRYDLALIHPKTQFIAQSETMPRRRLYQALGHSQVEEVSALYVGKQTWKVPGDPGRSRTIFIAAFDPSRSVFDVPGVEENLGVLKLPDTVLYDVASRPDFGPVGALFHEQGRVVTEVGGREVEVRGLFQLGTSFNIDASVVTSDLNFLRIFPDRAPGLVDFGLVRLRDGADPEVVRRELAELLPSDVLVLTRNGFIEREVRYWATNTPIGAIFGMGTVMGLVVGSIIVYQILFAGVSDHLSEYATLKAFGYTDRKLFLVVLQQAAILAALGFGPGYAIALGLYRLTADATLLPLEMTLARSLLVLGITFGMCCLAGGIALRKVRKADPADVF